MTRPRIGAIALAFLVSLASSVVLAVTYALGGQPQIEGACLFGALGGIAAGLVAWAHRLMPQEQEMEERPLNFGQPVERAEAEESFVEGAAQIGRRRFLGKLLGGAVAAFVATLFFPIRSLGRAPGSSLFHTGWTSGARAVTEDGMPVRARDLATNSVLTVFPQGQVDRADSQVIMIKMPPGTFMPPAGRETWSPDDIVAFSKVCTHAGCPVGLYQASTQQLFCPCHQSVFLAREAARPTAGPATRALPQLPLAIDPEGYVVAQRDFTEPIGPEFWNFGRS